MINSTLSGLRTIGIAVAILVATTGALAQQAKSATPSASAVPNYPHYRLVDFGTLGGSFSSSFGTSKQLNNRGEAIAQSETHESRSLP